MLSSKKRKVLLVDGYVREQEKLLKLSKVIPKPINAVIFEYQLLFEAWNKELSDPKTTISDDGGCIELNEDARYVFFGTHILKYADSFEWTLKIMESVPCASSDIYMFIGLIPANKNMNGKNPFSWHDDGGLAWLPLTGYIGCDKKTFPFSKSHIFEKKGDILQITYNSNESIYFTVNGQDLGNCLINKEEHHKITEDKDAEFRFVINVCGAKQLKMMIDGREL